MNKKERVAVHNRQELRWRVQTLPNSTHLQVAPIRTVHVPASCSHLQTMYFERSFFRIPSCIVDGAPSRCGKCPLQITNQLLASILYNDPETENVIRCRFPGPKYNDSQIIIGRIWVRGSIAWQAHFLRRKKKSQI